MLKFIKALDKKLDNATRFVVVTEPLVLCAITAVLFTLCYVAGGTILESACLGLTYLAICLAIGQLYLREDLQAAEKRCKDSTDDLAQAQHRVWELEDEVEGFGVSVSIERNRREKLASYIRQQNPDVDVDALILKADSALMFEE